MTGRLDLTKGNIAKKIFLLSLPIMGTSLMMSGYSIIDMLWVGKIGAGAVAAVGTAGFYPWLAQAFIMIARVGGEVKVAQGIGEADINKTREYIKSSIELNIFMALAYSIFLIVFSTGLISFFRIADSQVNQMAISYLKIIGAGMIFTFMNPVFSAIFNGLGNSQTPFRINALCLLLNVILDPILILGLFSFPRLGVLGAAIATVFAQAVGSLTFIVIIIRSNSDFFNNKYFRKIDLSYHKELIKLGFPVGIQSAIFTLISMVLGVMVAAWGPIAIAAQKVGTQIESISYMMADGMGTGMSAFTGQNYGAKRLDRVKQGIKLALSFALIWGIFTGMIMIVFGKEIFSLFINDQEAIRVGYSYLFIIGLSQIFNNGEIISSGIFKGLGKTMFPSIVGIAGNLLRIPLAFIISKPDILGLDGIWWTVTISSNIKGTILVLAILYVYKRTPKSIELTP